MSAEHIAPEYRRCPHGFHHPPWPHSCDGCWCEGERDQRDYGWPHDTTPRFATGEPLPTRVQTLDESVASAPGVWNGEIPKIEGERR